MKFAIATILLVATNAFASSSPSPEASVVSCKAYDKATDLTVTIDLQAPAGTDNVLVTLNGVSTWLAKTVQVTEGKPMTRLAGITWYQVGLFEPIAIDAQVATKANEDGVHGDRGGTVTLNGELIRVGCTAY